MKILKLIALFVVIVTLVPGISLANDPKDYIPAPAGTKAFLFYFDHLSGSDLYSHGDKVSRNVDLTGNVAIFRFAYYGQVGNFPWVANVLLPYGELALDNMGTPNRISHSGVGDPIFAAAIWPYANSSTRTWFGAGMYITPRWGEYDNEKPTGVQLAQNRWQFKPEVNFTKGLGSLPLILDLSGFVTFFTDNDKVGPTELTSVKDPFWHAESHFIWDINKTTFVSADYFYDHGGKTTLAGIDQQDEAKDHKLGITVGYMLTPSSQILLKGQRVVKTENSIASTDIGLRYAFFW